MLLAVCISTSWYRRSERQCDRCAESTSSTLAEHPMNAATLTSNTTVRLWNTADPVSGSSGVCSVARPLAPSLVVLKAATQDASLDRWSALPGASADNTRWIMRRTACATESGLPAVSYPRLDRPALTTLRFALAKDRKGLMRSRTAGSAARSSESLGLEEHSKSGPPCAQFADGNRTSHWPSDCAQTTLKLQRPSAHFSAKLGLPPVRLVQSLKPCR